MQIPTAQKNNPAQKGALASAKVAFGPAKRYALGAVHTRGDAVQWFVWDAETDDRGMPAVIRQEDTAQAAIAGLVEA